jgi:large subunit ribosomal protein L4
MTKMAKLTVYNLEGKKSGELQLSEGVFNVKFNKDLVHQAYVTIDGNRRQVIAHTKDRGERSGSGKKPWKQKGTGNARVGSVRTPVWRKGGIVFGPTKDRNFKKKINKKMMQKAVMMVLSEKLRRENLLLLENIEVKSKKTKEFSKIIDNLKLKGNILIGFGEKEKENKLYSRNIEKCENISVENLNVFDMLNSKYLIISSDSAKFLEEKYKNFKN